MNNLKKVLFLIAALVIPSLVYIFLRGFGDNKFEIPVYYSNGVPIEGCESDTNKVHLVKFKDYHLQGSQLFYFPQWINDAEFYRQCKRIKNKPYQVVFTAISDSLLQHELGNTLVVSDKQQLYDIANCALVLGQEAAVSKPIYNQLVLVDAQMRIRGYYNGNNLEDMDRLDVELDILSKEKNE
ncbi:MAG: hypothetical protein L3J29_03180 [Cyclobacteriaceae bacterium]|nr:hypothetical protein [Cyclobacteriaceae bacterium]